MRKVTYKPVQSQLHQQSFTGQLRNLVSGRDSMCCSRTLQKDRSGIAASVQLASGQTSSQLPITDTGCGIINNDITPWASGREDPSLKKNTLINPRRRRLQVIPTTLSLHPSFHLRADIPHTLRAVGGKKNYGDKKQTWPQFFFFLVRLLSQIVSADWYKHWLTWVDDCTVYGTHMLALDSLINPIRSLGETSRLIHILLMATHIQTRTHKRWPFSQDGSIFPWKCQTREIVYRRSRACVTSLVINTSLS